MPIFKSPLKSTETILALGAESAGNFSIFYKNNIYFSDAFGNLSAEENFNNFKGELLEYLKQEQIKPTVIITDLHPEMNTTLWGLSLSKKFKAQYIQVQHHYAHIFSAIGDKIINDSAYKISNKIYAIAIDGTGYGLDDKIWGGEIFKLKIKNETLPAGRQELEIILKIGNLENQKMLGGELAIKEPARILISILSNFLSKKEVYDFVKKYYTKNEFNLLHNQLKQNFNCIETSSAGRILDATSLLLGFCENKRTYKHEATILLEKNSTKPYLDIKPKIEIVKNSLISNDQCSMLNEFSIDKSSNQKYIFNTTHLFEYLIKNLNKDKTRLAATAQLYVAQGLLEIIKTDSKNKPQIFISGGIGKNKIISQYLLAHGVYQNKKIPLGDEGLSFGQIINYLITK
jgi:hydrogenase maturation protein HypF